MANSFLRCPHELCEVLKFTAAGALVPGAFYKKNDCIGIVAAYMPNGAIASGDEVGLYIQAPRIVVPKTQPEVIETGKKLYYNNSTGKVTGVSASGLYPVGVSTLPGASTDTTIEMSLYGLFATAI